MSKINSQTAGSRRTRRIRRENESGQALIELALVSLFFFVPLMIGAVEFARAAYCYIEVSNAARAAVQYGAQTTGSAADTDGMLAAARNDYSLDPTALSMTSSSVACSCSDTGSIITCSGGTCAGSGAHIEHTLTVNMQASFDPGFYEPFMARTFTVRGIAVQKVLQ